VDSPRSATKMFSRMILRKKRLQGKAVIKMYDAGHERQG